MRTVAPDIAEPVYASVTVTDRLAQALVVVLVAELVVGIRCKEAMSKENGTLYAVVVTVGWEGSKGLVIVVLTLMLLIMIIKDDWPNPVVSAKLTSTVCALAIGAMVRANSVPTIKNNDLSNLGIFMTLLLNLIKPLNKVYNEGRSNMTSLIKLLIVDHG